MSLQHVNTALKNWMSSPASTAPFLIRRPKTFEEYRDYPQDYSHFTHTRVSVDELKKYALPNRIKYTMGVKAHPKYDLQFVLGVATSADNSYHHDLLASETLIIGAGFMQFGTIMDSIPTFTDPMKANTLFIDGNSLRYPTVHYRIRKDRWFPEDHQPSRPGGLRLIHEIFAHYLPALPLETDQRPRPQTD